MNEGMTDALNDDVVSGVGGVMELPKVGKQDHAKKGRRKAPPRAKLTMNMLMGHNGVDALLENLRETRFPTTSLLLNSISMDYVVSIPSPFSNNVFSFNMHRAKRCK